MNETITITREEFDKMSRLSVFADYYLDDFPKERHPEQYESDKEEITQAQEVIQHLQALLDTVS
jgi:hypothetical protein